MVQKNLQTIDLTERKSLEYIHCRNLKFVKELLVDCRKSLKLCGVGQPKIPFNELLVSVLRL